MQPVAFAVSNIRKCMKANNETKRFFVYKDSMLVRIEPMNIIYLEASGSYCNIHLANTVITLCNNLSHVYAFVEGEKVLTRLNRSIVINVEHINRISGNLLYMSNGEKLYVGESAMSKIKSTIVVIR